MLRRIVHASLLALLLMAVVTPSAQARGARGGHYAGHHHHHHGRGRVFVGVGPFWWGPPYPYWYYYPPYYSRPEVVIEEPPIYIQRPAAQGSQPPTGDWYYCPTTQRYYPDVPTCQEPWIKVAPRSE